MYVVIQKKNSILSSTQTPYRSKRQQIYPANDLFFNPPEPLPQQPTINVYHQIHLHVDTNQLVNRLVGGRGRVARRLLEVPLPGGAPPAHLQPLDDKAVEVDFGVVAAATE